MGEGQASERGGARQDEEEICHPCDDEDCYRQLRIDDFHESCSYQEANGCSSVLELDVDVDLVGDVLEEMIDYGSERTGYKAEMLKRAVYCALDAMYSARTRSTYANTMCKQNSFEGSTSEFLMKQSSRDAMKIAERGSQTDARVPRLYVDSAAQIATDFIDETSCCKTARLPEEEVSKIIDDLECTLQTLHEQLDRIAQGKTVKSLCAECQCHRTVVDGNPSQGHSKSNSSVEEGAVKRMKDSDPSEQRQDTSDFDTTCYGDVGLSLVGGGSDGPVKVLSVAADGPIGRSGAEIPLGSRIVAVNCRAIKPEHKASQVQAWLRGPNGSSVQIDMMPPNSQDEREVLE
eukprot:750480-Hanusia_phi.AAC.18